MKLRNRQSKGQPMPGAYAPELRTDGPSLIIVDRMSVINDSFPLPQANNLEKVASVVDAVAAGANTPEAVGETLGIHTREGGYYADAAGYLGLVELVSGADVKTYELTPLGEQMLDASAGQRSAILRDTIADVPAVQEFTDRGKAGVRELLEDSGLGDVTAKRRASTITSWHDALAHDDDFVAAVSRERVDAEGRAVTAAERAALARAEREAAEAARNVERVLTVCTGCFIGLPASGICDDC